MSRILFAITLYVLQVILSFSFHVVYGQSVNFEDGFEDGNFTQNPVWSGADSNFTVVNQGGNYLLQLTDNQADTSFLSVPSSDIVGEWEFFIRFDGFSPSNSNRTEIFLMSNSENFNSPLNGYKLRGGENGSDDVFRLIRVTNGTEEAEVLSGITDISAGGDFRVKVTRDNSGNWSLEVAEGYAGLLAEEATGTDNTHTSASHFGLWVTYTSTRSDKFFYDFKIDLPPLEITGISAASSNTLDVAFSLNTDTAGIQPAHFFLSNGIGSPESISIISPDTIRLNFNADLAGGFYTLTVNNIRDETGQIQIEPNSTFDFLLFDRFEPGDVVINEFMKDPPGSMPEYVEVKNTTAKFLNLSAWSIGDSNSFAALPETDNVPLFPDSFLVITPDTFALASSFSHTFSRFQVSLPALNNSGDQIRLVTNNQVLADSLEYSSGWGGEKVALERRSDTAPSAFAENWGNSPDPALGTPGLSNQIPPDTTAPGIDAFSFLDKRTLRLIFTERITQNNAENPVNYILNADTDNDFPPPQITSALFAEPDSVILTFSSPFKGDSNGEKFRLLVENQMDIFGNILSTPDSITFTFEAFAVADSGDIVINEFMYDPGDNFTEFIELFNHSDSTFNINGFSINDNSGSRRFINNSFVLEPEHFVVIAPDSSLLELFPGIPLLTLSSLPALNNSGDDIVLRNQNGVLLDSLRYTRDFGGDEVSLERISPPAPSVRENFGDSPSPESATPGAPNLIPPDLEPPELLNISALTARSVSLQYSERVQAEPARNTLNYSVNPDLPINTISVGNAVVVLSFENPLVSGREYSISVQNQADIFGNIQPSASGTVTYFDTKPATPFDVAINEILYRRADAASEEFIELFNKTEHNFDLSNWTFGDAGNSVVIPPGTVLESGGFLVLTDRPDFASESNNRLFLNDFPSLNDSGDQLVIKNQEGLTIDSVFYLSNWGGNEPGFTLERTDPDAASNDASKWNTGGTAGGTPGTENSVFEPDEAPPEIIFARFEENSVFAVFDEFIRLTNETIFEFSGQSLAVFQYDSTNANTLMLGPVEPGGKNVLRALNIKDFSGNQTAEISHPVALPIEPGSIAINEILFDPLADPDDNLPDQTEFIEIFNPRGHAISLEGIFIHDAPDENGEIRSIIPVNTQFRFIPSGGHVLLYAEDEADVFAESRITGFYELGEEVPESYAIRFNRSSLGLASTGDAVFLSDSSGFSIDSVFYDENWHNPNRFDTDGISLERINPTGPSNDPTNWTSSTDVRGGTPGSQNSVFQRPGAIPENTGINFSPNPFTPADQDGTDDNLFITYTLDEPDYLLRVRIFDRYGRKVRTLADGIPAGFNGTLIWDGLTDDRRRNRVGYYIVFFEALNSAEGRDLTFKETVVIGRRF